MNTITMQSSQMYTQRSFISEMQWKLFKSLFWNTYDSVAKLTIFITSGVSLWDKEYVKLWQRLQLPKTYNNIKVLFLWL